MNLIKNIDSIPLQNIEKKEDKEKKEIKEQGQGQIKGQDQEEENDKELIQHILTFPFDTEDEKLYLFIIISNVSDFLGKTENSNNLGQITFFRLAREPIGYVDMSRTMASNIHFLEKNKIIDKFNPFLYTTQFFNVPEDKKNLIEECLEKATGLSSAFFKKQNLRFKKKNFFLQNILDEQSKQSLQSKENKEDQEEEQEEEEQEQEQDQDEIKFLFSYFLNTYEKYKKLETVGTAGTAGTVGNKLQSKDKDLKKFRKEFQLFIDFFNQNNEKENQTFILQKDETVLSYQNQVKDINQQYQKLFQISSAFEKVERNQKNEKVERNEDNEDYEFELDELENSELVKLTNNIEFEDKKYLNLVQGEIFDVQQAINKLTNLSVDSIMMNKQVFQNLDCSLNKIREDIQFIKTKIFKKTVVKKYLPSLPLRDPITEDTFKALLFHSGHYFQRMIVPKRIQLRLTYLMLYLTGLRINEVTHLQYSDFQQIIDTGYFRIDHSKTGDLQFQHFVHKSGRELIKKYKDEIDTLFIHHHFKYLGSSSKNRDQLMAPKKFITLVNEDIRYTLTKCNIPQNIRSHSFRITFITKLLKNTTLQNVSHIIGHKSVNSTMLYSRFQLTEEEKEVLFDQAFSLDFL